MHASTYPAQQSYYSHPTSYSFYYTPSGRYCAFDLLTGKHFIHNLDDNKWYPYFPTAVPSPQQSYQHQYSTEYNATGYRYQTYEYPSHGANISGATGRKYDGAERSRDVKRSRERSREGEFLYSAAAAEAAQRSLIEERDIGVEYVFEDEGVDMHLGDRSGRARKQSDERRRRSRSGPNDDAHPRIPPFPRESSRPRQTGRQQQPNAPMYYTGDHHPNNQHQNGHQSYHIHHQYQRYGSNQAGVGVEGSECDSGYMEDFEPAPEPRRAMPGVARWLDEVGSTFSDEDGQHKFRDHQGSFDAYRRESQPCKARVETANRNGDASWDRYDHYDQYTATHHAHYTEIRGPYGNRHSSFADHVGTRKPLRDSSPVRFARQPKISKTLHRQDSGIDMSSPAVEKVDIEIDIDMDSASDMDMDMGDEFPSPGSFPHGSAHPKILKVHRGSQPRSPKKERVSQAEAYDCYYIIPPCPPPPPPEGLHSKSPGLAASWRHELAPPHYRAQSPVSPRVYHPDSVFTASMNNVYTSPVMPPRAPSPPMSPEPYQRTRRFVPVETSRFERRYYGTTTRW